MNVYLPNLRLPSAYQEVEYIGSSGTQRIDTGFSYGGGYLRIDAKFMFNSVPSSNADFIYGVIGRSSNNRFLGLNYNSGTTFQFASGTEYSTNIGGTTGIIYDTMMKYEGGTMTMKVNNNTLSTSSTGNMYQGHSLPIFCRWDKGNQIYDYPSKIKLYSFKIYTSGTTLVRDFVPCYRKSDSVIGLYDLVNSVFYTNSGTGTFSKGNDVTMTELKNAYIGEVYEYSYDFANKSVSQLQNDGWTFVYIDGNTPPTFSSDGISNSTTYPGGNTVLLTRTGISSYVANANKVTLIFTGRTRDGQISHKFYRVANASTRSDTTGGYIQVASIVDASQLSAVFWWIYGARGYENINPSTYNNVMVTQTCVLDFINKTMTITDTLGFSKVLTLTDTQISNIKNNTIYDTIAVGENATIKSISTIIE